MGVDEAGDCQHAGARNHLVSFVVASPPARFDRFDTVATYQEVMIPQNLTPVILTLKDIHISN
jgi:hypothetical protein